MPQRVLLTGASRGLGAALAQTLAARGHRLYLAARSADELRVRADAIAREMGGPVGWSSSDLRAPADCRALADAALAFLGGIDVLINNAGIGSYRSFIEWSEDDIAGVVALNLGAPMLLARATLPGMLEQGRGYIVNIASDLARRPLAKMAPYVASKFGVLGFGASLHREVRDRGVRVTTVMPGIIDSAFGGGAEGTRDRRWAMATDAVAGRIADLLDLPPDLVVDELTLHPASGDY
jgi:short-subunit dehydrogenase